MTLNVQRVNWTAAKTSKTANDERSFMHDELITQTACHAYEIVRRANEEHLHREEDLRRPFYILAAHLKISRDGNGTCGQRSLATQLRVCQSTGEQSWSM